MNRIKKIVTSLCRALSSALLLMSASYADMVDIGTASFLPQRLEVGHGESAVAFADFDGDGHGTFREAGSAVFGMAAGAKNIAVGDINGDSFEDALISSWSSDALIVLGGPGEFRTVRPHLQDVENPWGLAVVDLNEDGKGDFVIADGVRASATVYLSHE